MGKRKRERRPTEGHSVRLLPVAAFSGPYDQWVRTGDISSLTAWADWLNDCQEGVPGVAEVLASVQATAARTDDQDNDDSARLALGAAPYLLPCPADSVPWYLGDNALDVVLKMHGARVRFEHGLPAHVSASPAWFGLYRGIPRLRLLLERFPRLTVDVDAEPAERYGWVHDPYTGERRHRVEYRAEYWTAYNDGDAERAFRAGRRAWFARDRDVPAAAAHATPYGATLELGEWAKRVTVDRVRKETTSGPAHLDAV